MYGYVYFQIIALRSFIRFVIESAPLTHA